MLAKSIRCQVPAASRGGFDQAQRAWSAIAGCAGLVGQLGGWAEGTRDALVLGLWRDADALRAFMEHHHDPLFFAHRQDRWYSACQVRTLELLFSMPGLLPGLEPALERATVLRTALCHVRPEAAAAFEDDQARRWRPEMAQAPGMLGGGFFREPGQPVYLVATLWSDLEAHAAYVRQRLPALRAASPHAGQMTALEGACVPLEPAWRVTPP